MIIGIVGSEGIKFTSYTEGRAKKIIRRLLTKPGVTGMTSGGCHLGGIDIWAEEIAAELDLKLYIYKPKSLNWKDGYAPRNRQIATRSDECYCITVGKLPDTYKGMTFSLCYHCGVDTHVKSGGCWTTIRAARMGKPAKIIVVRDKV